jgi:hypothetical protein
MALKAYCWFFFAINVEKRATATFHFSHSQKRCRINSGLPCQ